MEPRRTPRTSPLSPEPQRLSSAEDRGWWLEEGAAYGAISYGGGGDGGLRLLRRSIPQAASAAPRLHLDSPVGKEQRESLSSNVSAGRGWSYQKENANSKHTGPRSRKPACHPHLQNRKSLLAKVDSNCVHSTKSELCSGII